MNGGHAATADTPWNALPARLRTDADALVTHAVGNLDRPVPTCPGWAVRRVVGHTAELHRWATALVLDPSLQADARTRARAPRDDGVLGWYREGIEPMLDAFDDVDLDEIVDTWAGRRPRRWWLRRVVHETFVHRADVDLAVDAAIGTDPAIAADGLDELFENYAVFVQTTDAAPIDLELVADDVDRRWHVQVGATGLAVDSSTREHPAGLEVRADAADLLLLLWSRRNGDEEGFSLSGDAQLLERWRAAASF